MIYRTLGKTGIKASAVAFGGIVVDGKEPAEAANIVAAAVNAGVNYFDVAPTYGNAQYKLGPALQPWRKQTFLACKSGQKTAEGLTAELEESLKALKTDYFDVYQLHACDEELDTVLGPGGALEAIVKARQQGKVRFIGMSTHRERSALYLMTQFSFDTMMHPINWSNSIKIGKGDLALKLAAQQHMGRLALKTLALRPLGDNEPTRFPGCWYMPITDNEYLSELAMKFSLSRTDVAISPGAEELFGLMLKLIDRPGIDIAPNAEEMQYLINEANKVEQIFVD